MGYAAGDIVPFVLALDGAVSAPTVQVKRLSDGAFLDWGDNTFKSSGWTAKSQSLAAQVDSWVHLWDTTGAIAANAKANLLAVWIIDAQPYVEPLPIGYGAGGGGWDDLEADHTVPGTFGAKVAAIVNTDVSGLATRSGLAQVRAGVDEAVARLGRALDALRGDLVLVDGGEPWVAGSEMLQAEPDLSVHVRGAASLKLVVNVAATATDTALRTLPGPVDLSQHDTITVPALAMGAGQFLDLSFSEDGTAWTTWHLTMAEEDLNAWTTHTLDLTTMASRAAVRYVRISGTGGDIDQDAQPGQQLWPTWGAATETVLVWLDDITAHRTAALITSDLLAVADQFKADLTGIARTTDLAEMLTQDDLDGLNVTVDTSGLATKSDLDAVLARVQNTEDLVILLRDWGAARLLIENCDTISRFTSSDDVGLALSIDRAQKALGGASLLLAATTADAQGDAVTATYDWQRPLDLSWCDELTLFLLAQGSGDFLQFELEDSSGAWHVYPISIAAAEEGVWIQRAFSLTEVPNRGSVLHWRLRFAGDPVRTQGEGSLWPTWNADTVFIWLDRLEARRNVAQAPAGSTWA